jgi:hypothetical protein
MANVRIHGRWFTGGVSTRTATGSKFMLISSDRTHVSILETRLSGGALSFAKVAELTEPNAGHYIRAIYDKPHDRIYVVDFASTANPNKIPYWNASTYAFGGYVTVPNNVNGFQLNPTDGAISWASNKLFIATAQGDSHDSGLVNGFTGIQVIDTVTNTVQSDYTLSDWFGNVDTALIFAMDQTKNHLWVRGSSAPASSSGGDVTHGIPALGRATYYCLNAATGATLQKLPHYQYSSFSIAFDPANNRAYHFDAYFGGETDYGTEGTPGPVLRVLDTSAHTVVSSTTFSTLSDYPGSYATNSNATPFYFDTANSRIYWGTNVLSTAGAVLHDFISQDGLPASQTLGYDSTAGRVILKSSNTSMTVINPTTYGLASVTIPSNDGTGSFYDPVGNMLD